MLQRQLEILADSCVVAARRSSRTEVRSGPVLAPPCARRGLPAGQAQMYGQTGALTLVAVGGG